MKKSLLLLFAIFSFLLNVKGQTVQAYLTGTEKSCSFMFMPKSLSWEYENSIRQSHLFQYIQNNEDKIVKNENYQIDTTQKKTPFLSLEKWDAFQFRMDDEIPPFIDTVVDGRYVLYYNPIPYQDGDTLKFIKNKIAVIFEVKNSLVNNSSIWFTPSSQRIYKRGNYQNGLKNGNWWMENQKVVLTDSIHSFTQSYTTTCSFIDNHRDGLEKNITCPENFNSIYNITAEWNWKNDTLLKYTFYFDSIKMIQGNFNKTEDEWTFWDWKIKPNQPDFTTNKSNRYLLEHYLTNKQKKEGRGTIIRSKFDLNFLNDSLYFDHYGKSGIRTDAEFLSISGSFDWNYDFYLFSGSLNNFYYLKLPDDSYFTYYDGRILDDNNEIIVYELENISFSRYNYNNKWNDITNSYGYVFFYTSYERYYPNGQLYFKFKLDDFGNLERENDTIYWASGLPMNIVRFDSIKQEYEQTIYDCNGKIVKHKVYFENGNLKMNINN